MKYFRNRQNPLKGITENELDEIFHEILNTFGEEWLESNGDHPIQILWKRKDAMATNELYTLGYSISNMRKLNTKWVDDQIKLILGVDINNRRGAFFELIGLSYLNDSNKEVIPAKTYQCGYDGLLRFQNDAKIYVSMKNYGISHKHVEFFGRAKRIEEILAKMIKKKRIKDILVFIDCPLGYPTDNNWTVLESEIEGIINRFDNTKRIFVADTWYVFLNNLSVEGKEFHENYNSYTYIISVPYHKNEEINLYSKLDEACYDLSKHSIVEDNKSINIIFVHLPVTASINKCMEWAEKYFENNPEKPISGILFYQPEILQDVSEKTTFIHHCVNMRSNDKFNKWRTLNKVSNISLKIPVGKISKNPSILQLVFGDGNLISVENRYIFQSGNHYIKPQVKEDGSIVGDINKIASGIFTHCILELPNWKEGEKVIISGRFAPTDELLII